MSCLNLRRWSSSLPGRGCEKGLTRHLFTPNKFREIFPKFKVLDLRVIDDRIIALPASKV
jgi:hypothetical protein